MCKAAAKVPSLCSKMPVVLGGHEHDIHEVEVEGISILKPGEDAHKINVVDIWWTEDGALQSQYFMIPAKAFPVEEKLQKFHREKEDMLESMLALSLCRVPEPISSKAVRLQVRILKAVVRTMSGGATALRQIIISSLHLPGCILILHAQVSVKKRTV